MNGLSWSARTGRLLRSARRSTFHPVIPVLVAAAGVALAQPLPLRFPTGPPELVEPADPATAWPERVLKRDEYDAYAAKYGGDWFIPIRKVPESLSAGARFGVNLVFGGKNRGFAIDGDPKKGYVLYADVNGDGDLTDDPKLPLERRKGYETTLLTTSVTESHDGETVTYPVRIRFLFVRVPTPAGWQMAYRIVHQTVRRGTITIDGRSTAFALLGQPGVYDKPGCSLWIDLDGDDHGMQDEEGVERFQAGDRYVKLGGTAYEIQVDPFGRSVVLTPTERPVPERHSLAPGTAAPEFTLEDVDGAEHRLADYRGKVLLIDAWEPWCHPCREEAPGLASLYARSRDRGFAVLGLTSASAGEIATSARELNLAWPQASEPLDGPVHALFRISSFPTHILIDRAGRIVMVGSGGLDMQKFEGLVEATLRVKPEEPDAGPR